MEIYRHIPILLESGLVICTHIGKKKVYRAEDPRIIQELYEEQQERYNSHIERLREMYHYL